MNSLTQATVLQIANIIHTQNQIEIMSSNNRILLTVLCLPLHLLLRYVLEMM